jgi:hypothetical protein
VELSRPIRVLVKLFLRKHGCPPDNATQTVLEQPEVLSVGRPPSCRC